MPERATREAAIEAAIEDWPLSGAPIRDSIRAGFDAGVAFASAQPPTAHGEREAEDEAMYAATANHREERIWLDGCAYGKRVVQQQIGTAASMLQTVIRDDMTKPPMTQAEINGTIRAALRELALAAHTPEDAERSVSE